MCYYLNVNFQGRRVNLRMIQVRKMGKIGFNRSLIYVQWPQAKNTENIQCLSSSVNGWLRRLYSASCTTQVFPFSLSLHHQNNCLESTSIFYLSLFNSVAKKTILRQKKYWRGICSHPCIPPPSYAYACIGHKSFSVSPSSSVYLSMPPSTTFPQPFYCSIQRRCFSNTNSVPRDAKMIGNEEGKAAPLRCDLQFARRHRKACLVPLRPTADMHVAKSSRVYTMIQRLSRTPLTKPGFNPRAFINISVFIFRMHYFSTSQSGPGSTPWVPIHFAPFLCPACEANIYFLPHSKHNASPLQRLNSTCCLWR